MNPSTVQSQYNNNKYNIINEYQMKSTHGQVGNRDRPAISTPIHTQPKQQVEGRNHSITMNGNSNINNNISNNSNYK